MTAQEMIRRFNLEPHVEGGAFRKLYIPAEKPAQRPAHGVIYYLLDESDTSDFHVLRVRMLARRLGLQVYANASKSKHTIFYYPAFLREILAVWYYSLTLR